MSCFQCFDFRQKRRYKNDKFLAECKAVREALVHVTKYLTQQVHDVKTTSYRLRCDVMTSLRRWYGFVLRFCPCWEITEWLGSPNCYRKYMHCSSHEEEIRNMKEKNGTLEGTFFLLYTRKNIITRKSEKKFKRSNKNEILKQKTE